jgi:hypothetical protein
MPVSEATYGTPTEDTTRAQRKIKEMLIRQKDLLSSTSQESLPVQVQTEQQQQPVAIQKVEPKKVKKKITPRLRVPLPEHN